MYAAYDNLMALKVDDFIACAMRLFYLKYRTFPATVVLRKPHTHYITVGSLKIPVKQSTLVSKIGCGFEISSERKPVIYAGRRTPL